MDSSTNTATPPDHQTPTPAVETRRSHRFDAPTRHTRNPNGPTRQLPPRPTRADPQQNAGDGIPAPSRRNDGRRQEKSVRLESKTIRLPDGTTRSIELYARGGAVGIGELTENGDLHFTELPRVRTHRNRDQSGKYRWYNDYRLPHHHAAGIVTVRLHGTDDDTARKLNRPENVRPIAATDPDFDRLYPRRNDAESINRNLDDTLWLRRAHSIGHERQTLNLLGYALMVNGLALHRHRRRRTALAA